MSSAKYDKRLNMLKRDNYKSAVNTRPVLPKKVISSKTLPTCNGRKNTCTGKTQSLKNPLSAKPKKCTKSDLNFNEDIEQVIKHSNNIGDTLKIVNNNSQSIIKLPKYTTESKNSLEQFYKNEKFKISSDSVHETHSHIQKNTLLGTIKELPEVYSHTKTCTQISSSSNSEKSQSNADINEDVEFKEIKEFRERNFFECHSTTSRLKLSKSNDSTRSEHDCKYNFYLNERLFPIPIKSDYRNTIRCTDCNLPVDFSKSSNSEEHLNGTIQAKVSLTSNDTKEVLLMLPVKENLIIKERRRENTKRDEEVLYFGIIKLDSYGHSAFCNNLPRDSLALRYEKGYVKHDDGDVECRYEKLNKNDIVYI